MDNLDFTFVSRGIRIRLERFKRGFFEQICKLQLSARFFLRPFLAFHRTYSDSGPGGIFLLQQAKLF